MKNHINWNRRNLINAIIIGSITIILTAFGLYLQYRSIHVDSKNLMDNKKVILIDTLYNNIPTKEKNKTIETDKGIQNKKEFKKTANNNLIINDCQDIDSAFYNIAEELFTKLLKCEIKPIYGEKYLIYVDEFTDYTGHFIREGNYYSRKFQKELFKVLNSTYKSTNVINQWDIKIRGDILYSSSCSEIIIETEMNEDIGNTIITSCKVKIEQIHQTDSTDMPRPF